MGGNYITLLLGMGGRGLLLLFSSYFPPLFLFRLSPPPQELKRLISFQTIMAAISEEPRANGCAAPASGLRRYN